MRLNLLLLLIILSYKSYSQYYNVIIPFRQDQLWGYSDVNGNILYQPFCDSTGFFTYSYNRRTYLAHIYNKSKTGLINDKFEMVLSVKYDSISTTGYDFVGLFIARYNGKFGVFGSKDKVVVKPEYDSIKYNIYHLVYKKGKFGVCDSLGKMITPVIYDSVYRVPDKLLYKTEYGVENLVVVTGKKHYRIDKNGIKTIYNPPIQTRKEEDENYEVFGDQGGYQIEYPQSPGSQKYEETIIIEGDPIAGFRPFYMVRKGQKWGLYDRNGVFIVPIECSKMIKQHRSVVFEKNGLWGGFCGNGSYKPIEPAYQFMRYFDTVQYAPNKYLGLFLVNKNGKWGYVGDNGVEFFR